VAGAHGDVADRHRDSGTAWFQSIGGVTRRHRLIGSRVIRFR
jgi:hypothetical protein